MSFSTPEFHYFERIDSTQNFAINLLSKSRPIEGTAILAGYQTFGQGQFGRSWLSEPDKNLLCSVILYPTFLTPDQLFLLQMIASLSLVRTIETSISGADTKIKWPNDIWVNQRKIAGILIKTAIRAQNIDHAVIGLGVNTWQNEFDASLPFAGSLKLIDPGCPSPMEIFQRFHRRLTESYQLLKIKIKDQDYLNHLLEQYESKLMCKNMLTKFEYQDSQSFDAIVKGVTLNGQLMLQRTNGRVEYIHSGQIRWLLDELYAK